MSAVYGGISLVIMLFVLALVFGAVQPVFDQMQAVNAGIGGWAEESYNVISGNRGFVLVFFVIALFAGYILPEFRREDNSQSYKRRNQ